MRHFQKAGWALLAAAAAFGIHQASADQPGAQQDERSRDQGVDEQQAPDQQGSTGRIGGRQGVIESQSGQRSDRGQQRGAALGVSQAQPYVLGPLGGERGSASMMGEGGAVYGGLGAGIAPAQGGGITVPLPQYWLADAALFAGNAASTANVLSLEHNLAVPAPAVLGDQAQFLIAATNRALTSLIALQQNAEASNPAAVAEIRNAVGQLVAAQGAANQVADAASSGVTGPGFEATARAALQHLTAAERAMAGIGRAYNAPALASIGSCSMRGAALGAGLGPTRKTPGSQSPSKQSSPPSQQPSPSPSPQPSPSQQQP